MNHWITNGRRFHPQILLLWAGIAMPWIAGASGASATGSLPDILRQAQSALVESLPQVAAWKLTQAVTHLQPEDPLFRQTHLLLAESLLMAGRLDDMQATLAVLPEDDAGALLLRAHGQAQQGEWRTALEGYRAIVLKPSAPEQAWLGLAESLHSLSRTAEAADVLERFVRAHPRHESARLRLAVMHIELGSGARAREILDSVKPATPAADKWKGYAEARLLLMQGRATLAQPTFLELLRDRKNVSENLSTCAVLGLAETRFALEGRGKAEKWLESFIYKNPNNPWLELIFQRMAKLAENDPNPSESDYHKWAAGPEIKRAALARFYVGRMQFRTDRIEKALTTLNVFVGRYPTHHLAAEAHLMLAELHLKAKSPEKAIEALESAMRATKDERLRAEIELRTALVNYQLNDRVGALILLEGARRRLPEAFDTATFNLALTQLAMKNFDGFERELAQLENHAGELAGHLTAEHGFALARLQDARGTSVLNAFLDRYPGHPRRGQVILSLAELAFLNGDTESAEMLLASNTTAANDPGTRDHADYLAIFLADSHGAGSDDKVIELARAFLQTHPASPLRPEVHMKLGQVFYRRSDFLNAETEFATLVRETPDHPNAEAAAFLAGQSAMRALNQDSVRRSLEHFDGVVRRAGMLMHYARQQQAIIQSRTGEEEEAIKLFDLILSAVPPADAELRYAALCGKGDNLVYLGKKDPKLLEGAIEAFETLAALPNIPPDWRNQALYKKARALENQQRTAESLSVSYDLLNATEKDAEREHFWSSKAAFDAGRMFEEQEQWRAAVAIYDKLAKLKGPRAGEAMARIRQIRVEHFIWD